MRTLTDQFGAPTQNTVAISVPSPHVVAVQELGELLAVPGVCAAVVQPADRQVMAAMVNAPWVPEQVLAALTVRPVSVPSGHDLTCTVFPLAVNQEVAATLTIIHAPGTDPALVRDRVDRSAPLLALAVVADGPRPGQGRHQFGVDALTGRPNREFALLHLEDKLQSGDTGFAVLFCDLDGFKTVNDTLGHGVGDDLLRQVAGRLAGALPATDTLARVGGDEFLAIVHAPTQADAQRCAAALIDSLQDDFTVGAHAVSVGVSIGIALPAPSLTAETLISAADIAMYEAKKLRACTSALYTPALHAHTEKRRMLEHDLRHAVDRGEMSIAFQPVADLRTGALAGVEALLRWTHPSLGEVAPMTFIPLAEKSGLIDELGRFVLGCAVREFVTLKDRHGPAAPGYVAVNVSRYQLDAPDFVSHLAETIAWFGIEPSELHLELTESAAVLDATSARMTLMAVTDLGIGLDIDDFGAGYSSLSYLTRLSSLTSIKLDSSMIWQLSEDDRAQVTVRALIGLVHDLGLHLLAEGVETVWQRDWLLANGCDLGQGFILGVPVAPKVLSDWLVGLAGRPPFSLPNVGQVNRQIPR